MDGWVVVTPKGVPILWALAHTEGGAWLDLMGDDENRDRDVMQALGYRCVPCTITPNLGHQPPTGGDDAPDDTGPGGAEGE